MTNASPSITCPRCLRTSYNPNDVRYRYCGYCHQFLDVPGEALQPGTPQVGTTVHAVDANEFSVYDGTCWAGPFDTADEADHFRRSLFQDGEPVSESNRGELAEAAHGVRTGEGRKAWRHLAALADVAYAVSALGAFVAGKMGASWWWLLVFVPVSASLVWSGRSLTQVVRRMQELRDERL